MEWSESPPHHYIFIAFTIFADFFSLKYQRYVTFTPSHHLLFIKLSIFAVFCHWIVNDMWLSLHPIYKYSFNFQFLPIFFIEMLKVCDFYFPPSTNIHWIFHFCRFVHWNVNDMWLSNHPINKCSLNFCWFFCNSVCTICCGEESGKKKKKYCWVGQYQDTIVN